MIFKSIAIRENGNERRIDFSDKNNLVHSIANSKGKTTLLRLLLYSVGYNIPSTKNIKFEVCQVESQIVLDEGEVVSLHRESRNHILLKRDNTETTYILPGEETDLHKIIFKTENVDLIKNLLGCFYFDQEKGWTLLNRGVVVGSIRFNIEELIRGIADIDCTELLQRKEQKKQDLLKFQQMFSVSKYQETLDEKSNNLARESYSTLLDDKINQCRIQQNLLKRELRRIDDVLKENKRFRTFIAEIGLLVLTPNGDTVPVTKDNIVGLNDAIEFLVAKRKLITLKYNQIQQEIKELEKDYKVESQQLSFFDDKDTIATIFDKKIASIPINEMAVKNGITTLVREIAEINREIKRATRRTETARKTIASIFNNTRQYLNELGLNGDSVSEQYLFTSNLKELSGAILHKTVFAFRMSCLLEIEKHLGIKLPIILDSPSGKEIDRQNIGTMLEILNRDFSDNQIIIASIFDYNLKDLHKIELTNRLVEYRPWGE